ncbi:MAG: endolytic transglycosylase MltG [Lachnospiraceae bacterium]|nr:endolytic transglycosylase MltG [Lachnospiraceae bacterium]
MKKQKAVYSFLTRIIKILLAVILIMLVYMGAMMAYDFGYRIFAEKPVSPENGVEYTVVVEEGMSTAEVADMLEEKGIIRDALIFKIQNRLSHYKGGFRAGTYTVNTAMDNEEIMAVLSGEVSQE